MAYEGQLRNVWIFSQLEPSDIARIARVVVPRKYSKGETIVEEGGQAVAFYVILSGKVEIRKGGTTLNTLGAGEPVGEMALLDGYPRSTSVVAVERQPGSFPLEGSIRVSLTVRERPEVP